MRIRRFLASLLVAVVTLGALAPVAAADPAKPTNYRSRICRSRPTPAMTLKVVGGDGFLYLHIGTVTPPRCPGYDGEPWLRFWPTAASQENQLSPATYLNANRYGVIPTFPPGVGAQQATANPQWTTVAHGGTYVWHDHRIHYMTPDIAPKLVPGTTGSQLTARPDGKWVIPMTVDGHRVTVIGELLLLPAPNPLLSWGLVVAIVVVVAGVALVWRRLALPLASLLVGLGGVAALVAGWRELAVVPAQAGGNPVAVALPIAAIIAAILSVVMRNTATRAIARAGRLGGAAGLGPAPHHRPREGRPAQRPQPHAGAAPDRVRARRRGAAAVASVRSGALALAPLGDDDEDDEDDDEGPTIPPPTLTAVED